MLDLNNRIELSIIKNMNIKKDFPIFKHKYRGQELVYLDSAATSQKPQVVIDAVSNFYTTGCSNIHRAVHDLGEQATLQYNLARQKVAKFINAQDNEVIFTAGTTAGINFIATTWAKKFILPGDEIIISVSEHHANFVPWQQFALKTGAILKILNLNHSFEFDLEHYQQLLSSKTKLVALTLSSNVLGVINDLDVITKQAKQAGSAVLIDAAQAVAYTKLDVKKLNCDFLVFSGHKMLAPDGIGVLYLAQAWHDQTDPYQFGGGMVSQVGYNQVSFLQAPAKFEAGTPAIASIVGLAAAIDYYQANNLLSEQTTKYLADLCTRLIAGLTRFSQVKIVGNYDLLSKDGHLVSFTIAGFHAHDVAAYLDQYGICVRAGNHCAQPLHDYLKITATVRVSFHVYNTMHDVDRILVILAQLIKRGL